jgi:tetratricopeptide (TPR) repeat protein
MDHDANEPMDQLTAHLDRGWDLVQRGDLAGALVSAQKSIEVDEESAEAHNLLGYVLACQGRAEEALEQYKNAIDLEEGYVDAMLNAADVCLHQLGTQPEALRFIDEALDWLEDDEVELLADALLLKLDAYLSVGDRDAALRAIKELPDGPFEKPELTLQVGRARFDAGDIDGAEPLLRAAAEALPNNADVTYHMALLSEARGDRRAALVGFLQTRERDLELGPIPGALPHAIFERKVELALKQYVQASFLSCIEGALVVVSDLPGAEAVADGIDPRIPVLLDDVSQPGEPPRVGRVFFYQRNLERLGIPASGIEDEIARQFQAEVAIIFPDAFPSTH